MTGLLALFAQQVARAPDHPAIANSHSYATLDHASDRIARAMRGAGVATGDVVALRMTRSCALIETVLAVLKAGAIPFNVGTNQPASRLADMLDRSETRFVVSDTGLPPVPVGAWSILPEMTEGNAALPEVDASRPACIFHTSGTTGRPKLMRIAQQGIMRIAHDPEYVPITAQTRLAHLANPAFDAFSFEVWGALVNGATIVIFDTEQARDPHLLSNHLRDQSVSGAFITTGLFNLLCDVNPAALLALDWVITGGERGNPAQFHQLFVDNPVSKMALLNAYGPTECTTFATMYPIDKAKWGDPDHPLDVPIGLPVRNTEIVIDTEGGPDESGEWGEILIGGGGVSEGYIGDPETTAARFIQLDGHGTTRFYRTGDLGRWRNGVLECGGRIDHQVKIRGHRIELPEVSAALLKHPQIARAEVVVRDNRLCAFVVGVKGGDASEPVLRMFLKDTLPDYMLPQAYVFLPSLPLTSNGKVDQSALVAPVPEFWEHDFAPDLSFLQLGGDSLAAARLAAQWRTRGRALRLSDILSDRPLADVIAAAQTITTEDPPKPVKQYRAAAEQERLWLAQEMQPHSTAYSIPLRFDFETPPDPAAIVNAATMLVARHGALRSAFEQTDAGLKVRTLKPWQVTLERPSDEASFFARPFALGTGQLFRVGLIGQTLLLACHHITVDGLSLTQILRDFAASYKGETRPDAGDYSAYPDIQAATFATPEYFNRRAARLRHLLDNPAPSGDPVYLPASGSGRLQKLHIPADVTESLQQLAKSRGQSLFSVLIAIYAISLWRAGQGQRLSVGLPVGLRPSGFETAVGMFVNTQICRFHVDPAFSMDDWLDRVDSEIRLMRDQNDVAFDHQVSDLREAGHHEMPFETMFVLETDAVELCGLPARFRPPLKVDPRFPLTFFATRTAVGLECLIEHDMTHFTAETVAIIGACFEETAATASQGDLKLSNLAYVPDVLSQIDKHTKASPSAPAVKYGETTLSFAELNAQVTALAAALKKHGAKKGDHIGLALGPCPEMVAGLLAILHVGAAYVPMDPNYPAQRLAFIASDAGVALAISDGQANLPQTVTVISPDAATGDFQREPHDPDAMAYVIYTSGSTGQPKGVGITHRALSNYLRHVGENYFDASSLTGAVVSTSLSFDATITSLLGPLCAGLPTTLLAGQDGVALTDAILEATPQLFKLTPAHLVSILEYAGTRISAAPHLLVVGGEQLPTALVRKILERLPKAQIVNEYGPTEATVGCTTSWAGGTYGLPDWNGAMPIGRAIYGTRITLVNTDGTPTQSGETGEIVITGIGVAAGYLNRPDLTAKVFAPLNGGPSYRTGDLAIRMPDGNLAYCGRVDSQIKLNGFRIEPGEIEAALTACPQVTGAAVVLSSGQLVAFFTGTADAADLRSRLHETLPAHMRPARLVPIAQLPLTSNGKVDRKALLDTPVLDQQEAPRITPVTATDTQEQIAAIFCDVLGYPIAPDQHFFDAGAGSLALMKIHATLRREIAPSLALVDLFRMPTLAQLAAHIDINEKPQTTVEQVKNGPSLTSDRIAIVGMAVGLPAAPNLAAFWDLIRDGKSAIKTGPSKGGNHVNAVSSLDGATKFDPVYFGMTPRDAKLMDPQQRHLMMGAVHALENAGLDAGDLRIGIIAGSSENTYQHALMRNGDTDTSDYALATLHEKDFLVTRIAHHLNLRGPALTVQTACSSSLVAVHQACQILRTGDADVMLAGGVCVDLNVLEGYTHQPGHIFSADGKCAPFSRDASGTVPANGWGLVVLRPLEDAVAAGDRIMAVIEGSAVNNDGSNKVGFTAPSEDGQTEVIVTTQKRANITAATLGYVEAHGTATPLGDPIEVAALARACGGEPNGAIMLGTVKSQLGHLGAAAGVVGLVRAVLAIAHSTIPPTLGFDAPHPSLDFASLPLKVASTALPWPETRPHAGISSFGMGGTNAHVVIAPAPQPARREHRSQYAILLADQSEALVQQRASEIADRLEQGGNLGDFAIASQRSARNAPVRAAILCGSSEEAIAQLREVSTMTPTVRRATAPETSMALVKAWQDGLSAEDLPHAEGHPAWDYPPMPFALQDLVHPALVASVEPFASKDPVARLPRSDWFQSPIWRRVVLSRQEPVTRLTPKDLANPLPQDAGAVLVVKAGADWPAQLLPILREHGSTLNRAQVRLCVVTKNGPGPEGTGEPDIAMLSGFLRSVAAELPAIAACLIDTNSDDFPIPSKDTAYQQIAVRNGRIWQVDFTQLPAPRMPDLEIRQGTYLITGGSGGIAQSLARHILTFPGTEVILASRSGKGISGVQTVVTDVSDPDSVAALAQALKDRRINGIIHTAGLAGGSSVQLLSDNQFMETLAPKRTGALAILEHLASLTDDFVMFCSSLSAVTGVLGQADYGAANAWLDACADAQPNDGPRVISVNWPAWRDVGMSSRLANTDGRMADHAQNLDAGALSQAEAWDAFQQVLAMGQPHVVVSPLPLDAYDQQQETPAIAPTTEVSISDIFAKMLGVDTVDPATSFYDLGGDSLLGLDLLDALARRGIDLPASILSNDFSVQSIEKLCSDDKSTETPLVVLREGISPPVVLIHPVGGDVASYRSLAQKVAPGRKIIGIQDPVLYAPETPEWGIKQMAQNYLALLDGPMSLAGWSFGGLIGVAMAQEAPERVIDLVLIDPPLPDNSQQGIENQKHFLAEIAHRKELGLVPDDAPRTHPYIKGLVRAWTRNSQAMRGWQPQTGLATPTQVFLAKCHTMPHERAAAWQKVLPTARFTMLDADHFTILHPPAADALVRAIGAVPAKEEMDG